MSDETPTLGDAIEAAIMNWFLENPGMPMAYVAAVDWIDGNDGAATLTVANFDSQPTHRSLGLVRYLDAWYDDDVRNEIMVNMYAQAAGEDEDDD